MKILFLILFFFISLTAYAQPGPIKIFRYFDDFTYLKDNDTIPKKYFEKLKHIPINKKVDISFGGEIREQYQYFKNSNFGDLPPNVNPDKNGHLWHRAMVHTNIEIGQEWQVFAQLNSTFAFNKNFISPEIDENQLSLHQAFIDWRPSFGKGAFVRVGRQEFGYGSESIIAMREGPNTRLTFDAALVGYESEKWKLYSFYARPVISQNGVFDDNKNSESIWTLYAVSKLPIGFLDTYYFGYQSDGNLYNYRGGDEIRHSLGLRYWIRQRSGINMSVEGTYQFGTFGELDIRAFNIAGDIKFQLKKKVLPSPGLAFNFASGDKGNEGQLNTYNLLFSRPAFGLSAPIGAMNIINFRPYVEFYPIPKLKGVFSNYFMWRMRNTDGTYTPGRGQIRPNPVLIDASDETYIGNQLSLELLYTLNVNWSFGLDVAYFIPGEYVEETGNGKPITYFSFRLGYKI